MRTSENFLIKIHITAVKPNSNIYPLNSGLFLLIIFPVFLSLNVKKKTDFLLNFFLDVFKIFEKNAQCSPGPIFKQKFVFPSSIIWNYDAKFLDCNTGELKIGYLKFN